MDFTLTNTRYGRSNLHPIGQLTHTRRSDGAPVPDGTLKTVTTAKIIHYRQIYLNRPDPIVFMPLSVDTSDRIYFLYRLICLLGLLYHYLGSFVLDVKHYF
jgi:hypothetical protein